ncbi:hypothetical protein GCM10009678_75190 [Actinomadura kijaniata]|uniref:DUF7824 domain-containing protein n=1 Tax=Actinomadura namibiensis TaxID=182080 RepID=A0A7W3LYE6_ACTNM|nr:DUF6493 family protein [Actinomadura namibiensis]MBA8956644.1 hypothetical protein [Actinomadura namibiensis]
MTAWDDVRKRIEAKAADDVAAIVAGLPEEDRRAVATELPGHLKRTLARARWFDEYVPAFRAAGAGTIGGAAGVATWLNRRQFTMRRTVHQDTDRLLRVLRARPADWLADLAGRLTLRLSLPGLSGLDLALALLRETGVTPPDHDPLVIGWARDGGPRADDPLLPHLLPRLFEVDGVGPALEGPSWARSGPHRARQLKRFADEGRVDRRTLLDRCVSRFLRGGDARELRFFTTLHAELEAADPAARRAETVARARDYLRLLPAAPVPVAELALRLLRELDDPDVPDPLDLTEALDALLFRPEAGLVGKGLSWLAETVERHPALADECAPALAQTFAHDSPAVRRRAVSLALKLPVTDPTPLREATGLLPFDLGQKIAARFGGEPTHPDPAPPPLTPDAAPRLTAATWARPVDVARPLGADEAVDLIEETARGQARVDRLLEGLLHLARTDRDGLRAALARGTRPDGLGHLIGCSTWPHPYAWLTAIANVLAGTRAVPSEPLARLPRPDGTSPLHLLVLHRCAELLPPLGRGVLPPVLLATPTEPTGHLDPLTLVERLERYEAAALEPGAADLQQALLRLPAAVPAEAVRRAEALTSAAARTVAGWLAREGPPRPRIGMRRLGDEAHVRLRAPATGLPLIDAIFNGSASAGDGHEHDPGLAAWDVESWSSLLPSHPDTVAAHLLPHLRSFRATIADLATASVGGPFAKVLAWDLVALLNRGDRSARETLTYLAARGELPTALLGRALARRARNGDVRMSRLLRVLEDLAEAGGYQAVWETVAAALPDLLPAPDERAAASHAPLLGLALRTARWCEARAEIPELAALASRKGNSDVLQEARALNEYLTGPRPTPADHVP